MATSCRLPRLRHGAPVFCCVVLALTAAFARAELVDRIDAVEAPGAGADIVLRMTTQVLYLRHAPLGAARDLRIYLRVAGPDAVGTPMEREVRNSPPDTRLPRFRLSYPESDGSLLLSFDRPARFRVGQGPDMRSIRVTMLPAEEQGAGRGGTP